MDDEELLDDEEEGGELNIPAIVIAVVLLLSLIGGGTWFFAFRESPQESPQARLPDWEPPENQEAEKIIDLLPQLIINPYDSQGRSWLLIKIDLAVNNSNARDKVLDKPWLLPQAQNIIIDIFSNYNTRELKMPNIKEEARKRIKRELNTLLGWQEELAAENEDLPPIKKVYFVKYMLQ